MKDIISGALFPEAGLESRVGYAGGAGGLVIVRDLDLFSYCESCLLPFQVKCHIGYIPSGRRVVGLSKLSRVAEAFAKRLQDPQRLANEICEALQHGIKPTGVAVVLQCSHIHFPDGKNHQGWEKLSVVSGLGVFDNEKADSWTDFIGLLRFRGINAVSRGLVDKTWCPCTNSCKIGALDSEMLNAVSSILGSLGEDPSRKELLETPARFINWLLKFKYSELDMRLSGPIRSENGHSTSDEEHICSEVNLPFWSQCEHHLLPFHGVVHIGFYHPDRVNPAGKSRLEAIVRFYGFKLQVQERLTRQIAEAVSYFLGDDTIVVVEASHTCMISRGIEKFGSSTATVAVLGRFSTDTSARTKFLQIIPNSL